MTHLKLVETFNIKVVDMKAPDWPTIFIKSFKNTGFAIIKNHDIDFGNIDVLYKQWAEFFKSSKKHLYMSSDDSNSGYIPFRTENAKDNPIKDLKEFYHTFYPFENLPQGVSKMYTDKVGKEMLNLGRHLLFALQPHLPQELTKIQKLPLHQMIKESRSNLMRILHYPPLAGDVEPGAIRAAAHEDINLITLLPAATQPGLEVMDLQGEWHKVQCDPGTIILNVGDMLTEATNGLFKSTTHRVVNPEGENVSRFSMPMFVHPRSDCRLSERYTAGEYLHQRLKEIGLIK